MTLKAFTPSNDSCLTSKVPHTGNLTACSITKRCNELSVSPKLLTSTYQKSKILILTFCYKNCYILPDKEL